MARTTLDLDEKLIAEAMSLTGARSKKALIEDAVREVIASHHQRDLLQRIDSGDLGIDMTLEELFEWRGCNEAREETKRLERKLG
jgi:Arc/MetJ family transcription regulator